MAHKKHFTPPIITGLESAVTSNILGTVLTFCRSSYIDTNSV